MTDLTQTSHRPHVTSRAADITQHVAQGDPDELLSPKIVGSILNVTEQTLDLWRKNNYGPPWLRLGPRIVRYPRGGFVAWLRSLKPSPPPKPKKRPTKPPAKPATKRLKPPLEAAE